MNRAHSERSLFECRDCGIHEWRRFGSLAERIKAERQFGVAHTFHDWRAEADYVIEARARRTT